ncbi:MAG: helix-turn-helix transcriptional regulator [Acidobacteriota bacterium]
MKETIEQFNRMAAEARKSVGYWAEMPIVEFTEDICRLMDEQGVSRAELARRLGTSRAYITKLLGGDANFTLQTMTRVAMALGGAVHVHVAPQTATVRWREKPPTRPIETSTEADLSGGHKASRRTRQPVK